MTKRQRIDDWPDASEPYRVGGVEFLNARPLIYRLEEHRNILLEEAPPSHLASRLDSGRYQAALIPSIDYQTTPNQWTILPIAAIGSAGAVLTVQVFSKCPPEKIDTLFCDLDSHTSITLAQIVWHLRYSRKLNILPLEGCPTDHQAVLLIGDKVLSHLQSWPYQLDLGHAWDRLTHLPFVYAFWALPQNSGLDQLVEILERTYRQATEDIDTIAERYGSGHGFDPELAKRYLTRNLSFKFGPEEIRGLARFFELAHQLGLISQNRPLQFYEPKIQIDRHPISMQNIDLMASNKSIANDQSQAFKDSEA